jgi:hypothetical protein
VACIARLFKGVCRDVISPVVDAIFWFCLHHSEANGERDPRFSRRRRRVNRSGPRSCSAVPISRS